jgi:hypothetical protein
VPFCERAHVYMKAVRTMIRPSPASSHHGRRRRAASRDAK